jgi:RNA polymerase sigma factor (sigma-70 family)
MRGPLQDGDDDERQSESLNDSAAEETGRRGDAPNSRLAEFEHLYRSEFGSVASYFARRSFEPQLVADLTADTFVAAIHSFDTYDPSQTSQRAWILGIARRVYARYRESDPRDEDPSRGDSIRSLLDAGETEELIWWIEVERASRDLIGRLTRMSTMDREAVELVDLCGLTPAEAARELGISSGALRVRLVRSRARLRREGGADA